MKARFKQQYPDLVRIVRLVNYEAQSVIAHWRGRFSLRQRKVLRGLRRARGLKLNIACGSARMSGWVNIDASPGADVRIDLRRRIPLPDGCASLIFCEHFCDHLNFPDGISRFLRDCHRLLEPGGCARFVLHDAADLMRACLDRDADYFQVAEIIRPTMMEAVNFLFRFEEGHQFLYDFESFQRVLHDAGFSSIVKRKHASSPLPDLVLDLRHPSREVMSMYVEAAK